MSISRAISTLAAHDPTRIAVRDDTTTLTRRQLDLDSNRLARAYADLGVRRDDLVTIALPNSAEFYLACAALWKLGAIPQPVSAHLPLVERQAIVELADSRLIVGVDSDVHPGRASLPVGYQPSAALSDAPLPDVVGSSWKAPTSGGSTGRPKIIVSGTPGQVDPTVAAVPYMPLDAVQLVPGPLYHNGPFIYSTRGLLTGHTLHVMGRFDTERTLALIEERHVTWMMVVPTMMHRIWRLPTDVRDRYDLSSLQGILHLGAPCPTWLKQAWIDWLGSERVWELYAGTESQAVVVIDGTDWLTHRGSVGRPVLDSQVRILDDHGQPVPAGTVGEIYMLPAGGQGSTYRYIGAEPKAVDGWESLGDLGYLDADGYLYLADRSADLILSGGANVYPAEVEAAIDTHPAVRSSAVIGLPDDDLGERVHAIVDIADAQLTDTELLHHLHDTLARYKIPRTVEFVTEPVRDDAGKVRRSALRTTRLPAP